jgi:hypothetical protein
MFDLMKGGMMGSMGNPDAVPADSFSGGLEDLQSALMESNMQEIDELTGRKMQQEQANMGGQDQQLMLLIRMLGGGM